MREKKPAMFSGMFKAGSTAWWSGVAVIGFGFGLLFLLLTSMLGIFVAWGFQRGYVGSILVAFLVLYAWSAVTARQVLHKIRKSGKKIMIVPQTYRARLELNDDGSEIVYPTEEEWKARLN